MTAITRNIEISPIIREMTRSITEILGDTKLEPLEIELLRPRSKNSSLSGLSAPPSSHPPSRHISAPFRPVSPPETTPDTKVFDMLRPFCQPVDDLLPGGKIPPELGPVVGEKRKYSFDIEHEQKTLPMKTGSRSNETKVEQDTILPSVEEMKKRPAPKPLEDIQISPVIKKSKKTKETSNPRRPRFTSIPVPTANSSTLDVDDEERKKNNSKDKSAKSRKRKDTPSPSREKSRRSKTTPRDGKLHSKTLSKSKSSTDDKLSRDSKRRSDRGYEDDADVRHTRRDQRDRKSRPQQDTDYSSDRYGNSEYRQGRDHDRSHHGDEDRGRDGGKGPSREHSHSPQRRRQKGRDKDPHRDRDRDHQRGERDQVRASEKVSRRTGSEIDTRNREPRDPDLEHQTREEKNASQNTSSDGTAKQNHSGGSRPSSFRALTPLTLSPATPSKACSIGQQGSSEHATKESSVSQMPPTAPKRGRNGNLDLAAVKANQRALHTSFLASKAKCADLYSRKEYDAYEEEAKNTFRLGFDFGLARETELRLGENEFKRLSKKDRTSKKNEIITHYKYLTRQFAIPRSKELDEIGRGKTSAFFKRGVQKVYLRIFALQRLWERDLTQSRTDTKKAIDSVISQRKSGECSGTDLSGDSLLRLRQITADYCNMLNILEFTVRDVGDGHEEAGGECHVQ